MKSFLILGAMVLAVPAAQASEKHYQYKDLSREEARVIRETPEKKEYRRPAKTIEEKIQDSKNAKKSR